MEKIGYRLPPIGTCSLQYAAKIKKQSLLKRSTVLGATLVSVLTVIPAVIAILHTGVVLDSAQKIYYHGKSPNRFTPTGSETTGPLPDGRYRYANLAYGTTHPNSFLTITLPAARGEGPFPVVVYLHGGAWIFGTNEEHSPCFFPGYADLFRSLCAAGYAIVNMDYALMPEGRFPVPLFQLDEALAFLKAHGAEYGLDMGRLTLMGSSAGASIAAQYAAACANPAYASLLGLTCSLRVDEISALVINEAPLTIGRQSLDSGFASAHYLKGTLLLSKKDALRFDATRHIGGNYPPSYLLASDTISTDMRILRDVLKENGVPHGFFYPKERTGEKSIHCYLAMLGVDPTAREAYQEMLAFLREHVPPETR